MIGLPPGRLSVATHVLSVRLGSHPLRDEIEPIRHRLPKTGLDPAKPAASSVYVRVPEAPCPHERSISVMSRFSSLAQMPLRFAGASATPLMRISRSRDDRARTIGRLHGRRNPGVMLRVPCRANSHCSSPWRSPA